ncbi:uncharacterized protein EV420DRAFT_1546441 [Desarmillaria tabescens]|uniref:DUF6534 domain-containing protein n=1 Tax=Armillaria tabescens TaxID=1929756 RepID=A0AA39N5E5_ARMTA|nr:uncharacterized protein EV420DRAFT_1546441 [Desarmillaria tabescens]KAK0458088.1 hypothetical protein EV420DRAFT_1546441 [Desarmillaria tabescens]
MVLYTSQLALSIYCLSHFSTAMRLYYWIWTSLFLDGACSIIVMANVYTYLIINDGSIYPISIWMLPTIILLTYTSASIAQAFFCYRYWTVARNRWITGWIIILITAHMLCSLASCLVFITHPTHISTAIPLTIASSAVCAITDLTIAGSLAWTLSRIQSPCPITRNLLRRVMIHALTCGFTTAFSTTLMSILMFTAWNAFYTIFAILGRIYSLTILFNLILLKASSHNEESDDGSEPQTILSPICEFFCHGSLPS